MLDDRIKMQGDPDPQETGLEKLDKSEREYCISVTMAVFQIVSR